MQRGFLLLAQPHREVHLREPKMETFTTTRLPETPVSYDGIWVTTVV